MITFLFLFCFTAGGRTSDAIVDAALSALRSLVKGRLSGKSGGYSSGKQVIEGTCVCSSAGDCLVQEIKAPNSVMDLEEVSGIPSSPGPCPVQGQLEQIAQGCVPKVVSPRTETPNGLHSPGNLFQCLIVFTEEISPLMF